MGPEPVNTPLHQIWIRRRTALIQTTLDGSAKKRISVFSLEIKSGWKRFTKKFSEMTDSEKKINNIKEFYGTKSVNSLMKQLSNLQ